MVFHFLDATPPPHLKDDFSFTIYKIGTYSYIFQSISFLLDYPFWEHFLAKWQSIFYPFSRAVPESRVL